MDAQTIHLWIRSLGLTYADLIAAGVIPNQPLVKPFESSQWPTMHPEKGLELLFGNESQRLDQLVITLIPTVGQPAYSGDLPAPFSLHMKRDDVRSALGEPAESKGPEKLPGGLGMRGGWDAYLLAKATHPNAKVTIGYLEGLAANNISFALVDAL